MQYWDEILFEPFLSTIRGERYGIITQDEIDEELFHLVESSIATFKFPRIPLDYDVIYAIRMGDGSLQEVNRKEVPEAIPHGAFKNNVTYAEINVLLSWMKALWFKNHLSDSDNFEHLYTDINIKTYSRANLIDKNKKLLELFIQDAKETEINYGRVSTNHKPSIGEIN